jgi:hypothetical protein
MMIHLEKALPCLLPKVIAWAEEHQAGILASGFSLSPFPGPQEISFFAYPFLYEIERNEGILARWGGGKLPKLTQLSPTWAL